MKIHKNPTLNIQQPVRKNRGGFTLVELLVVITIIAALSAVAFFSARSMMAKSKQANAMSGLRQVGGASLAYSSENNGDIPTLIYAGDPRLVPASFPGGGGGWVRNTFWGRLQPYIFAGATTTNQGQLRILLKQGIDQVFSTKDSNTMEGTFINGSRIYKDTAGLPVPIAFNHNLYQWNNFKKTNSFDNAGQVIYAVYGFAFFKEKDGEAYVPRSTDRSNTGCNIYYGDNRKALAVFLDGHVEAVAPPMSSRRFR